MKKRLATTRQSRTGGPRSIHVAARLPVEPNQAVARRGSSPAPAPANPYGGVPSGGITYPAYYRPTEYIRNNNNYFPGTEPIGEDEMRISFIGSTPFPPTHSQAGTCIMVELGNGKRFFFDFGSGCMRNIVAMQVAVQTVTDIFFTHLHVDHYADLPYLYAFAPWMGRWKPLRVHGPSGRTPREGIRHLIEHMKEMAYWHTDSFNSFPIGDGYEVEVNEFDFRDDNGICYEQDGVTIRHWRRSHTKDGASAYRLDWNGLAFVWTGDGRPDELTAKLAKGVDVFVTELQPDTGNLTTLKYGTPAVMTNTTIDQAHTPHYATGYLFSQVQPRLAMCTHFTLDGAETPEMVAGIRTHWKGLFQFGAPDVVVVNVTKDAIWTRKAALPDSAMPVRPSPADAIQLFDLSPTQTEVRFPNPRHTVGAVQEQFVRDREYDPARSTTRSMSSASQVATSRAISRSTSSRWSCRNWRRSSQPRSANWPTEQKASSRRGSRRSSAMSSSRRRLRRRCWRRSSTLGWKPSSGLAASSKTSSLSPACSRTCRSSPKP